MRFLFAALFMSSLFFSLGSCDNTPAALTKENRLAMAQIFIQDDSLGRVRDHACLTIPLSQAINNYVESLQALDYSKCPSDFKEAFDVHLQAWLNILPVSDKFPEARGKLLDIFKTIKTSEHAAEFEPLNKAISDTWNAIDAVLERE